MKINRYTIYLMVSTALILHAVCLWAGSAKAPPASTDLSGLAFERIAVMPFLLGKLESADMPVEKPLSQPLSQLLADNDDIQQRASPLMTRLVHETLRTRFQDKLVAEDIVHNAFGKVSSDRANDTPRKLAVKIGDVLAADLVVVGTVWRFREKAVEATTPGGSASLGFAVYLVDVASGRRLWRGAFDGTQKALTDDVLAGLKTVKMGVRWLSAEELARYGVKQVFRKFPLP